MGYGVGFASQHAGQSSFSSHWFAWGTAVLDFFAMLLSHYHHCSAFNVIFIECEFENVVRAGFNAFAAAVAPVSVYGYEVVA